MVKTGILGVVLLGGAAALLGPRGTGPATEAGPAIPDTMLARMLSEIQPAVERSSGLEAVRPLNVAAASEARLKAYLAEQMEAQLSRDEAEAITAVYARLGLVPDTLDLPALLTALLQEQVVGYYDPKSDTLFVHERVTGEQLAPVLAHELVHALQDQHVSLDSLLDTLRDRNDATMAYQAAVEGHATFAMMEWQFADMTGGEADLATFPDLGPMLASLDLEALGDFGPAELLVGAPRILREGLLFPYLGGVVFVQRAWKARPGRPLPFGEMLPRSTEQVLHVERWLNADEPTRVRFTEPVGPGWSVVYEKDLGELETRIFLEEHLGADGAPRAAAAAEGWDGDAYRLLRGERGESLLWTSVWDSAAEADEFREAVGQAYAARYADGARAPLIVREEAGGRSLVTVLDLPPGVEPSDVPSAVELVTP